MGHDWVFDVLRDLRDYAAANGFKTLAVKADEALHVAMAEILPRPPQIDTKLPEGGKAH